jgi:hypothetical protein
VKAAVSVDTDKLEDTMSEQSRDTGIIVALAERFREQRLPRALQLKERVDRGEKLSAADIEFLEQVFADAQHIGTLADRHPEWQPIVAQAMHMYKQITEKALENERSTDSS